MGKKHLLRFGLASMLAGSVGLGGVLAACGDDEASNPGTNTPDTGPGSETGTPDTGGDPDTGTPDTGVDAGPPLAKLTLINAAVDLGDDATLNPTPNIRTQALRICFKTGTTQANLSVAPYPPLPREAPAGTPAGTPPGLYLNTGGAFPSFGIDLEGRILIPIVMNAKSLAAKGYIKPTDGGVEKVCDELLDAAKTTNIKENEDYWILDEIPSGTFKKDKSFLIALTGCVANAAADQQPKCGPGFTPAASGKGNLKVTVLELTRTPIDAAKQGVQAANLSSQYEAIIKPAAPYTPGFTAQADDAGAYRNASATGAVAYQAISAANGIVFADSDLFASAPTSAISPGNAVAPVPLPLIQALSGLGTATAPTVYVKGKNFVFINVGDPSLGVPTYVTPAGAGSEDPTGNSFNLRKYHYVAFPTDPAVVAYKP